MTSMKSLIASLFMAWTAMSYAEEPKPVVQANLTGELIVVPKSAVMAPVTLLGAILALHPGMVDAAVLAQLSQKLQACLDDNSTSGVVQRSGQDLCPEVSAALVANAAKAPEKAKK
jgi:hypothetical protein